MGSTSNAADIVGTTTGRHPADLVETGNLLRTQPNLLSGLSSLEPGDVTPRRHDVVVVGAGQAGLSVGYHLKRKGIDHVILEGASRVGDVWRNRWDSLRLFTPAKFDGLDGYRFPTHKDAFPTKDQMADYLESFAERFDLPVRLNNNVERLSREGDRFRLETSVGTYEADRVVVAAASYRTPQLPEFAQELDGNIVQMHSREYRNPGQIPDGIVLLVGAGNSGAEIAMELARTHDVYLAGRDVGHFPFDTAGFLGRSLLARAVFRGMFHHLLTMRTPLGRKVRSRMHGRGLPLIRTRPSQLKAAGVNRVGRITGFRNGKAVTENGEKISCATVIWCTGYHPGFDWIDLPVLDEGGMPRHRFGRSTDIDGLYFAGLLFQYAVSSTMVAGVGRDARRVAGWIATGL